MKYLLSKYVKVRGSYTSHSILYNFYLDYKSDYAAHISLSWYTFMNHIFVFKFQTTNLNRYPSLDFLFTYTNFKLWIYFKSSGQTIKIF